MRDCEIKGRKAVFHKWVDRAWTVGSSVAIGGSSGGQMMVTNGLVEYDDGSVGEVPPSSIRFTDKEESK